MKLSTENRSSLWILLRFLGIYLFLLFAYQLYLLPWIDTAGDPFSRWVAVQANELQNILGFQSQLVDWVPHRRIYFFVEGCYRSRMAEGCNAISVMILFASLVFAFWRGPRTWRFVGFGLVFLYILNIIRIALLNIVYVKWPAYAHATHDYLFPTVIYGGVVILWFFWLKRGEISFTYNARNIGLVTTGVILLICVRILEEDLFYDPLLHYFKTHLTQSIPRVHWGALAFSHSFRFILNLIGSCLIIQGFFARLEWTKQAAWIMSILFGVSLAIYTSMLATDFPFGKLIGFYVRRFVIQPLGVLVLLPIFYWRIKREKETNKKLFPNREELNN